MKLTFALLVTLWGVGLALTDPFTALHDSSLAADFREMVNGKPASEATKVQAPIHLTSTAAVDPTQDQESTLKVVEKTTEDAGSKSAEDKAEIEGKAAEESIFSEEEQAMFREETNVFFDKAEELAREVMGEDLVKEAQALEAISDKDFTAEHEQKFRKVMQEMIEKFSTPEALEEIQKFADQPEVRAEVQKIGEAVEQAAVMAVEEMMLLEQAMFLENALYMDPQAMFNAPVVFMDFVEIPESSVKPMMKLPENILRLEERCGGNLFTPFDLQNSEFTSEEAKARVEKAFVLQEPMLAKDGKLADAKLVYDYLIEDNHAALYHQWAVEAHLMKTPRQPEQPAEAQPAVTTN